MSNDQEERHSKAVRARRTILKSLAAGGGIVAAGKSLPAKWSDPVVDSVVLPAHAQSSPSSSVFSGLAVAMAPTRQPNEGRRLIAETQGLRRKVLEFLVPSAHANHIITSFCTQAPRFTFEILDGADPRTVRVCISFDISDDGGDDIDIANATFPTSTTISGNSIADAQRTLNDDEVDINLTNMVLSGDGDTITGNYSSSNSDDCPGSFIATRTSNSFSCPGTNTDTDQ